MVGGGRGRRGMGRRVVDGPEVLYLNIFETLEDMF